MKIIWLASYPRSGNTWVRFLLLNWLYGAQKTTATLQPLIPDVHEGLEPSYFEGRAQVLVKNHLRLTAEMPLREYTAGVIYIVRHPVDVLVSNLNYLLLNMGVDFEAEARLSEAAFRAQFIEQYLQLGGQRDWLERGMGTWSEHVASWLQPPLNFPTLLLRYEDLWHDLTAASRQLQQFLQGVGWESPRLMDEAARSAAIEAAEFKAMRYVEEQEISQQQAGFFYHAHRAKSFQQGRRFINQGQIGQGKAMLSEAQYQRAVAIFGPIMGQLGYT